MAVIMDEYASQIAAQYGDDVAAQALKRSSSYAMVDDPYEKDSSYAMSTAANPALTVPHSRAGSTLTTGYNSQTSLRPTSGVALYDRNRESTWAGQMTGQGQGYGDDVDDSSRYGTTGSGSDAERERETQYSRQQPGWAQ